MTLQTTTNPLEQGVGAVPIPEAALESLAARVRGGGIGLLVMRTDRTIAWHDHTASNFFLRYVLPRLQYPDPPDKDVDQKVQALHSGAIVSCRRIPGVTIAAFAYLEKRTPAAYVLLAGKDQSFGLTEDVLRLCSRLGLDGGWLQSQASTLLPYDDELMARQARLVQSMLRDQIRLTGLEQELDSLSAQLSNTYEELSLIYQLSSGMKVNRRASEFFQQVCLDVMEVISVRGMGVVLIGDSDHPQDPVLYGPLSLPPGKVHRLANELIDALPERKGPLMVHDLASDRRFHWLAEHAKQLLAVPLQRQDHKLLGCLFGLDKISGEFDTVDSKLLNSIANESAIYLENSMLYEDVRELMMGLLHSLTSAVDAKDTYTCGHSERVALLSRQLAQQIDLSDQEVERVYMAGLLHDVGKIGVPEAVLQKSGKLTEQEFALIKKHPEIGARILRDIKQIEDIIPGVMHHHERYDGKGYPAGLAGEDIPLMGRIICLADCFDAMTSSRTYRQALPLEAALEEIHRCAGTQFDPRLAEAFLNISPDRIRSVLHDHQTQAKRVLDIQQNVRSN